MSSTRPFFREDFPSEPLRGPAPQAAAPHAAGERRPRDCPVLARIPDAAATSPRAERRPADGTQRSQSPPDDGASPPPTATTAQAIYRVDPPQSFAPHRGHTDADPLHSTSTSTPRSTDPLTRALADDADALPILIRLAVRTWQFTQPYQPMLRAAAMFALVATGGMSMALMVGSRQQSERGPAGATAVAVEKAMPSSVNTDTRRRTLPDTDSSAEFQPVQQLDDNPGGATTSAAPTAIGPAGSNGGPTVGSIHRPQVIAPANSPIGPPKRAVETAVTPSATSPYPATSYPTLSLPGGGSHVLPQPRTAEPPHAVARLRGHIEDVPAR